jgi:hypothetical protein
MHGNALPRGRDTITFKARGRVIATTSVRIAR